MEYFSVKELSIFNLQPLLSLETVPKENTSSLLAYIFLSRSIIETVVHRQNFLFPIPIKCADVCVCMEVKTLEINLLVYKNE